MIVLSRYAGEKLVLEGGRITVTVVSVRRSDGYVRLAIECPPDVRVDREEIHLARLANVPEAQA